MSDEFKDELISSVAETVDSIAENIVQEAITEAVEEKIEELLVPETDDQKVEELSEPEEVVMSKDPEVVLEPMPFLGTTTNGAIGSMSADKKSSPKKKIVRNVENSYVISERSLFINGVGRLWKGFNVIPKKYEEKWLSLSGVRKATKEEIDKEYGR